MDIGGNGFFVFGSRERIDHCVFRSDDHIGGTKKSVAASRIDAKFLRSRFPVFVGDGKIDFGTVAFSNPVLLHVLDALRPVQFIESLEQTFGVKRDAHEPLFEIAAFDFLGAAFFVGTVSENFFVGADDFAMLAPPDLSVIVIGEALGIAVGDNGFFPLRFNFCGNRKFGDGATFLQGLVEPCVIQAGKNPLGPLVILGIRRVDFLVPIVRQTEPFDLPTEIVAILLGGDCRVRSCLDGVLFSGKSKGVPAHRVQYVESLSAFVTANDICCCVTFRVSYMQARAGGIRKHVEAIILGLGFVFACFECLLGFPVGLPFGFYLLRIILCHFMTPK